MKRIFYYLTAIAFTCALFYTCKKEEIIDPIEEEDVTEITGDWVPPIGIPRPSFGIEETYRMYDDEANRNPDLTYTENAEGGFYTHYINFNTGNDDSNEFGTAENPRETIPLNLPEGCVVELHGSGYDYEASIFKGAAITGTGTSERPIFVRGGESTRTEFHCRIVIRGSYIIAEKIIFTASDDSGFKIWNPSDHISIRNNEATNYIGPYSCFALAPKSSSDFENDFNEDIVFYKNHIHDNGNDLSQSEFVHNDIQVQENSKRIWIVDNILENGAEDGIHIIFYHNGNYPPEGIYIGRNIIRNHNENAIDIKHSWDIIVSENTMSGYQPVNIPPHDGSDGSALVMNAERPTTPRNCYIIFNEIFDSNIGIRAEYGGYIFGNVFRDIDSEAITLRHANPIHIVNNTFNNVDIGVYNNGGGAVIEIINNLISKAQTAHIQYNTGAEITRSNNFYCNPDGNALIGHGSTIRAFSAVDNSFVGSDPLFTDAANNNFSLQAASTGVNNGITNDVSSSFFSVFGLEINFDIEGKNRPNEDVWDIGAYEYKED